MPAFIEVLTMLSAGIVVIGSIIAAVSGVLSRRGVDYMKGLTESWADRFTRHSKSIEESVRFQVLLEAGMQQNSEAIVSVEELVRDNGVKSAEAHAALGRKIDDSIAALLITWEQKCASCMERLRQEG